MTQLQSDVHERFEDAVALKFQLYNSLFLSLPFHGIEKTGALLTLFSQICDLGFDKGLSPQEIVDRFFAVNTSHSGENERIDMLFRFVQYVERQVVLFDAIEDASFRRLHDMRGIGTLGHLSNAVKRGGQEAALEQRLHEFGIRLVLTAHPTQFYPGVVLGIINDLSKALEANDTPGVKLLLQQLGRTPFFNKEKPSPFDEALALIWYLENVFYHAIGEIVEDLKSSFPNPTLDVSNLIRMGFWSGGDRDGNPFVTVETTRKTAVALRQAILRCYYYDLKLLRRRLTFTGLEALLEKLDHELYENAFQKSTTLTKEKILGALNLIRQTIIDKHDGLFLHLIDNLIAKVEIFGISIGSLDIRQDSSVHTEITTELSAKGILPGDFDELSEDQQLDVLLTVDKEANPAHFENELTRDTLAVIREVKSIQQLNGPEACSRYIISHTQTAVDVARVFGLFLAGGWGKESLSMDIAPLFETVEDLQNAAQIMRKLYSNKIYRDHLELRDNTQTVMLGFSDGTKDGGYLMANYGIYHAKKELTTVSREFGIEIIFFDGRGGPPARGGGKTHRFYASMGEDISNRAFEVTVQGQTVSSNFGTIDAARYNIEQLLHAGLYGPIFAEAKPTFTTESEQLLSRLAETSFEAYCKLKTDPAFLNYLENATPLRYFGRANIGSRPAKRGGKDAKLTLESLRAIPFVGSWSQMKQNVPGFYGVGTSLQIADREGKLEAITALYKSNQFFKALIDNCEMAMQKTFLPLTAHLENDSEFGSVWRMIRDEYDLCGKYLAIVTDNPTLMTDFPVSQQSVRMREDIVQPLTAIQQYALGRLRKEETDLTEAYEKLIVRCSFGIINAGRNSA